MFCGYKSSEMAHQLCGLQPSWPAVVLYIQPPLSIMRRLIWYSWLVLLFFYYLFYKTAIAGDWLPVLFLSNQPTYETYFIYICIACTHNCAWPVQVCMNICDITALYLSRYIFIYIFTRLGCIYRMSISDVDWSRNRSWIGCRLICAGPD